eukprot:1076527-Rhodomonas_salina.2
MQRAAWRRRFGWYLGQAATTILDGRMCLPLVGFEDEPLDSPNLPTCFDEASEAFVDAIVAEYLVTGVVEWYPAHCKPLAICPIGTVPKKTRTALFRRLVVDSRGPNER